MISGTARPRPSRPSNYDKVFDPAPNKILVFGSNLAGIHAVGARRYAYDWCGAIWEKGEGLMGNSYAIPIQDHHLKTLQLDKVESYVEQFIIFAWERRDLEFFVTRLGCDRGEYTVDDIAPLFVDAPPTCEFPDAWVRFIAESSDSG